MARCFREAAASLPTYRYVNDISCYGCRILYMLYNSRGLRRGFWPDPTHFLSAMRFIDYGCITPKFNGGIQLDIQREAAASQPMAEPALELAGGTRCKPAVRLNTSGCSTQIRDDATEDRGDKTASSRLTRFFSTQLCPIAPVPTILGPIRYDGSLKSCSLF